MIVILESRLVVLLLMRELWLIMQAVAAEQGARGAIVPHEKKVGDLGVFLNFVGKTGVINVEFRVFQVGDFNFFGERLIY